MYKKYITNKTSYNTIRKINSPAPTIPLPSPDMIVVASSLLTLFAVGLSKPIKLISKNAKFTPFWLFFRFNPFVHAYSKQYVMYIMEK